MHDHFNIFAPHSLPVAVAVAVAYTSGLFYASLWQLESTWGPLDALKKHFQFDFLPIAPSLCLTHSPFAQMKDMRTCWHRCSYAPLYGPFFFVLFLLVVAKWIFCKLHCSQDEIYFPLLHILRVIWVKAFGHFYIVPHTLNTLEKWYYQKVKYKEKKCRRIDPIDIFWS